MVMQIEPARILVFEEDYESMRDLQEHLQELYGWEVELTASKDTLECLAQEKFDLLVIDLMIRPTSLDESGQEVQNVQFEGTPWLRTGLEFLRRLRMGEFYREDSIGTSPDVPAIILSAVADLNETELNADIRIDAFVEKPFRLEVLTERIRSLLQES
jgi:CheY-like chemotaxis protein